MSGGHFQYRQYEIGCIADEIEQIIIDTEGTDRRYSPEVVARMREGVAALRKAHIYAHRIDWLVSGDDGEDYFIKRLNNEIGEREWVGLTPDDMISVMASLNTQNSICAQDICERVNQILKAKNHAMP